MSDEMKVLNEKEVAGVSGGANVGGWYDNGPAPHANGTSWQEGGMVMYRIAQDDYLGNIAQRFGTSIGYIMSLNPGKIQKADLIRAFDTIRVR